MLIKNCKILIDGKAAEKNILINDIGKIEKIIPPSSIRTADNVIDAKGNFAIPGAIDAHVHCREPGMTQKEDFHTAGKAAAAGGITTILDMPNTIPATTTAKLLEEKRKLAKKCVVNHGFHFGATSDNIEEIKKAENIAAVKVYMGSSTGTLLVTNDSALEAIFRSGKTIAVHAESEAMIKENSAKYNTELINDPVAFHLKLRNNAVASNEVERAISIAMRINTKLHICHLSTPEELELVKKSKTASLTCEASPHHLFLNVENARKLGNFAKVNPPIRSKNDVARLWNGVEEGLINIIATDHAPHTIEEKELDYWNAPSGVPGLETMLPLLLDAVNKNRLSLQQMINLTSSNPARIFRIRNKGALEKGFDADITIIDLKKEKTIKNDELLTKCGWSPFNSWKLKGSVMTTIINGHVVYEEGSINESAGREVEYSIADLHGN